jgi:glutathione S-transferase
MSTPEIALHGTELSGHCHRVELMLRMFGLPHRYVVAADAARSSQELHRLNPMRQIPVSQDGDLPRAKQIAAALLPFMNHHLSTRSFLAADHATIADLVPPLPIPART